MQRVVSRATKAVVLDVASADGQWVALASLRSARAYLPEATSPAILKVKLCVLRESIQDTSMPNGLRFQDTLRRCETELHRERRIDPQLLGFVDFNLSAMETLLTSRSVTREENIDEDQLWLTSCISTLPRVDTLDDTMLDDVHAIMRDLSPQFKITEDLIQWFLANPQWSPLLPNVVRHVQGSMTSLSPDQRSEMAFEFMSTLMHLIDSLQSNRVTIYHPNEECTIVTQCLEALVPIMTHETKLKLLRALMNYCKKSSDYLGDEFTNAYWSPIHSDLTVSLMRLYQNMDITEDLLFVIFSRPEWLFMLAHNMGPIHDRTPLGANARSKRALPIMTTLLRLIDRSQSEGYSVYYTPKCTVFNTCLEVFLPDMTDTAKVTLFEALMEYIAKMCVDLDRHSDNDYWLPIIQDLANAWSKLSKDVEKIYDTDPTCFNFRLQPGVASNDPFEFFLRLLGFYSSKIEATSTTSYSPRLSIFMRILKKHWDTRFANRQVVPITTPRENALHPNQVFFIETTSTGRLYTDIQHRNNIAALQNYPWSRYVMDTLFDAPSQSSELAVDTHPHFMACYRRAIDMVNTDAQAKEDAWREAHGTDLLVTLNQVLATNDPFLTKLSFLVSNLSWKNLRTTVTSRFTENSRQNAALNDVLAISMSVLLRRYVLTEANKNIVRELLALYLPRSLASLGIHSIEVLSAIAIYQIAYRFPQIGNMIAQVPQQVLPQFVLDFPASHSNYIPLFVRNLLQSNSPEPSLSFEEALKLVELQLNMRLVSSH